MNNMTKDEFINKVKQSTTFYFNEYTRGDYTRLTYTLDIEDPEGDLVPWDLICIQIDRDAVKIFYYDATGKGIWWLSSYRTCDFQEALQWFLDILPSTEDLVVKLLDNKYSEYISILNELGFEPEGHSLIRYTTEVSDIKVVIELLNESDGRIAMCTLRLADTETGKGFTKTFEDFQSALNGLMKGW